MAGFRESLKQAVRQIAFRTSLDRLKKQGVNKVSVLGLDRIVALIDEAVHRSLKTRLAGFERDAVADATKAEFLRMLRSNQDLERQKSELERLKDRAEEEVDQLRLELQKQQQMLEKRLAEGEISITRRYEGENAQIAGKVNDLLSNLGSVGDLEGGSLKDRVYELVMDTVLQERQSAEEARRALGDREVSALQRRIKKLTTSLEATESRLRKVAAMKNIDEGISSVFREVQGLTAQEPEFGKKKEMMSAIFEANVELLKKIRQ